MFSTFLQEIIKKTMLMMPEFLTDGVIELYARKDYRFDADMMAEIDSNRLFLREYLLWVDKTNSIEDCHKASDMFRDGWNQSETFAYSLVLKETGRAVGSIDLHNVNQDNKRAEIGYWLAERYNGRGLMSRAVQLIEKQAFSAGLHRLEIRLQKENLPSARVAERNGYVLEGTLTDALFKYGSFYDELVFAKVNKA